MLMHNHPSGDPAPSQADLAITKEIRRAAETLRISLLDHVIVAGTRCMSFAREGLL